MQKELIVQGIRMFMQTNMLHRRVVEQQLNSTGVFRSQHHMLMCLHNNPGMSQKELAKQLSISAAATAVSLKKLEKGGYVRKVMDSQDNRFNRIELTEQGKKVVDLSHVIFDRMDGEFFRGFTDDEIRDWCRFMERVQGNLKSLEPPDSGAGAEKKRNESEREREEEA